MKLTCHHRKHLRSSWAFLQTITIFLLFYTPLATTASELSQPPAPSEQDSAIIVSHSSQKTVVSKTSIRDRLFIAYYILASYGIQSAINALSPLPVQPSFANLVTTSIGNYIHTRIFGYLVGISKEAKRDAYMASIYASMGGLYLGEAIKTIGSIQ